MFGLFGGSSCTWKKTSGLWKPFLGKLFFLKIALIKRVVRKEKSVRIGLNLIFHPDLYTVPAWMAYVHGR